MNSGDTTLQPDLWLKLYGNYLFSIAFIKLSNREIAEDIVQETFIAALKAKETFKNNSSEKTWLTTILNNKIVDYYRKKDVLKNSIEYINETSKSFDEHFFEDNGHWLDKAAPQEWNNADKDVNRNEFYRILQYCIQKMPPKLVPVFIAKFIDENDPEIICKEYEITSSNYWVMLHRARVLIRSCLEKNWFLG